MACPSIEGILCGSRRGGVVVFTISCLKSRGKLEAPPQSHAWGLGSMGGGTTRVSATPKYKGVIFYNTPLHCGNNVVKIGLPLLPSCPSCLSCLCCISTRMVVEVVVWETIRGGW
eukprot:13890017-Ditylum_brightwellii.AAC.1